MCHYRWFVQAHSPVCSTRRIAQTKFHSKCGKVRLGGGWSMFQEVGGFHGVSEGGGVISHSLGEKAVEQSGGVGSDVPVPSS